MNLAVISRKIRTFVLILLIIYLASILADLLWLILDKGEAVKKNNNQIAINSKKLPTNIFGEVEVKVHKKTYQKVQATKLNLQLIGIIKKKINSYAIIKDGIAIDKIYKIGDNIDGRAELKVIADNFVILEHNGNDEKLIIEFKVNNSIFLKNNAKIKSVVNGKDDKKHEKDIIIELNEGQKTTLKTYLDKAKKSPSSILAVVRVDPSFVDGSLKGFKVYPSKEKLLFKELGFIAGDLIVSINGVELDTPSKAFKIGKELASFTTFNFIVNRGNEKVYIYVDLN